jgi:L-malate glycosyltransferase
MKKPIGVAQIVHSLEVGGMERVALHLATHLNREKWRPLIVCLTIPSDFATLADQAGVEVVAMNKQPGIDLVLPFRLAKLLRDRDIRIIHAHNSGPWFSGALASLIGGRGKVVVTDHSRAYPIRMRLRMVEWALHHFVSLVSVSHANKEDLVKNLWIPAEKIRVIQNGVAPVVPASDEKCEALRHELGLRDEDFIFLFVARFEKQKGIQVLLQAARLLKDRHPEMRIVLLGKGSLESELPNLIRRDELEKNVIVAGFRLDVTDYYRLGHCLVMSSFWEGLPMSVLEAISSGLPVVTTDVGDLKSAVVEGENGFLVDSGDPDALADAMARVMDLSQEDRAKQSRASRRIFDERFHVDVMVRQYEAMYEDIL